MHYTLLNTLNCYRIIYSQEYILWYFKDGIYNIIEIIRVHKLFILLIIVHLKPVERIIIKVEKMPDGSDTRYKPTEYSEVFTW